MRKLLLVSSVLLAACGSKSQPGAPATGVSPDAGAAPPGATAPPTIGAPDPAKTPTVAPPATEAATTAAPTAAAVEDAGATAPSTADAGAAVELPADLPKVPGMAPEAVFRLLSREPGCVGIGKSGRSVLSIVALEGDKRQLRLTELGDKDRGFADSATWDLPADAKELLASPELTDAVKSLRLVACETTFAENGATSLVVGKPVPITVAWGERVSAQIEGNKVVNLEARAESGAAFAVVAAYWSADVGNLFLRMREGGSTAPDAVTYVSAVDLGNSECVPRPAEGKPLAGAPPAFDPAPSSPSCVAMTADGRAAAFKIFYVDADDKTQSRPNSIEWYGPGDKPDIDLSCMARSCKAEDKARIEADAARLGLVGCANANGGLVVDGVLAPFMYQADQLKLKTTTGWRSVFDFDTHRADGGTDKMWHMWQHPAGGPLFVYVGLEGTNVNTVNVKVLDDDGMKLCPKAPDGTQKVTDVKVASAASDGGGYRFGGGQLVDGDPTTSWQPNTVKAGEQPWAELALGAETTVTAVEIANGFQRRDGNGDMFAQNARIAEATLTFADGATEKVTFGADERGLKRFDFAAGHKTTSVKLTVTALHDGSRWPKDLAVSEVRVIGQAP